MKHYMIFALAFFFWTCLNLYLRRIKREKIIQKEMEILNHEIFKDKIISNRKQIQNTLVPQKATINNLKLLVFGVIFLWFCLTFYDLFKDFSWEESIDKFKWVLLNVKINLSTGINN
jgi:hypothetical protein